MYEMSRRKRIFKLIYIFILSLFPPDRTVQSGARTHRALTHYFHIGPALPVLSTRLYRRLRITPHRTHATGIYASPLIELTLPAPTHHHASNSRYRRLRITPHRTHATGAYASLRTMPTLPAPTHHSAPCPRYRRLRITTHRTHATGAYASGLRYRRLRITPPHRTHATGAYATAALDLRYWRL